MHDPFSSTIPSNISHPTLYQVFRQQSFYKSIKILKDDTGMIQTNAVILYAARQEIIACNIVYREGLRMSNDSLICTALCI